MEDSEDVEVFEKNPIPLPNVEGAVLEKVLEWCNQHKNDPAPQEEEEENHDVPECDKEFLKVRGGYDSRWVTVIWEIMMLL